MNQSTLPFSDIRRSAAIKLHSVQAGMFGRSPPGKHGGPADIDLHLCIGGALTTALGRRHVSARSASRASARCAVADELGLPEPGVPRGGALMDFSPSRPLGDVQ